MFPSLLTILFFACSILAARHSVTYVGTQRANFGRQIIGVLLLGLWAHLWGGGLHGATFGLFFLSGVIGFGFGDSALFEALPRIGPALTILLCQCLAAPIGAVTERLWLGTQMTFPQIAGSAVILAGVALALAPAPGDALPAGHRAAGLCFGVMAAAGQAWGAVLSRYAFQRAHAIGLEIDGMTAAYQRLLGGVASIGVLLAVGGLHARWRRRERETARPDWRRGWPWIAANAVVGPALGVSCYQWALQSTPSSIVLPIVATTPVAAMLLGWAAEGNRPTRRAMFGSVVAVAGVILLVRSA